MDANELIEAKVVASETFYRSNYRYKYAFLFLVLFLIGFIAGIAFAQYVVIEKRLEDSVMLGGIVINKIPYDLKGR